MVPAKRVLTLPIEQISERHDTRRFKCGKHALDHYLKKHACRNTRDNVSTTYVLAAEDNAVQGYYSICTGSVERAGLPDETLPRYPQIGVILLARWAVDTRSQGRGLGKRLFYDALRRSADMSRQIAAFALVVDAIDDQARVGYAAFGFQETLSDPMKLFLPMTQIFALNLDGSGPKP